MRLPRGRPPAIGIDNNFFNLTPPSVEAVTPTNEDKPIVKQAVETKSEENLNATQIQNKNIDKPPINEIEMVESIEKPVSTENLIPNENPVSNDTERLVSENMVNLSAIEDRLSGETIIPVKLENDKAEDVERSEIKLPTDDQVERFVLAAPLDINPNPHS